MVDSVRREENNQIKNDFVQLRLSHETYSSVIDIFVESGQVAHDNLTTDNSTSGRSPNESSNQTQAQIHIEVNVSKEHRGLSTLIVLGQIFSDDNYSPKYFIFSCGTIFYVCRTNVGHLFQA